MQNLGSAVLSIIKNIRNSCLVLKVISVAGLVFVDHKMVMNETIQCLLTDCGDDKAVNPAMPPSNSVRIRDVNRVK